MSPERWNQIESILDEVLEQPPAERTGLLDAACGEDEALHQEVAALLASCEEVGGFLETHPYGMSEAVEDFLKANELPALSLGTGERVGPYTIIRPIGEGGMGAVYLAERSDGQFRKFVALKIVKRGMDTTEILRRFRSERQILARLEHPNVARLLDGGVSEDGLPYFVMEYVDGTPIHAYCDARNLPVWDRLRLFRTVCEAVQYAHRNLVVHRDLKPSNVLVTPDGTVKLLDFGIAKVLEDDAPAGLPLTRTEVRRMTPEYAAPEQVRGELPTLATDVYALGIMLYELLTGRRPYRFKNQRLAEIEATICDTVPDRPSTAVVRTDTTDEDQAASPEARSRKRKASPAMLRRALHGDLDAITLKALKKEPERRYASAAELAADIERYLKGHPVTAQDDTLRYRGAKFVRRHKAGVAAVTFAFLALLIGFVTAAWQARVAARQALFAEHEADRANVEADRANATLEVIVRMLENVDPKAGQGSLFTARDLIQAGLKQLPALDEQPRVQATMMNALGRVSLGAGLVGVADSLHEEALALQRRVLGPDHADVAESLARLARVYEAESQAAKAESTYTRALAIQPEHLVALGNLGLFYLRQGRFEDAVSKLERAIRLNPRDAQTHLNLGVAYYNMERWAEARHSFEQALALRPSYRAYSNLATLYYYFEGRYADAARMYEQALALNPKDYLLWGNLGAAHFWAGHPDEARGAYRRAIEQTETHLRQVNPEDATAWALLGSYRVMVGEQEAAWEAVARALMLEPEDAEVMFLAGYVQEQRGLRAEALGWLERALANHYPPADIEREPGLSDLRADARFQSLSGPLADAGR